MSKSAAFTGEKIRTLYWQDNHLFLLDQTVLPEREIYREYSHAADVADAIRRMVVRGAPAIGLTAAYGVALAARETEAVRGGDFLQAMAPVFESLAQTRPTAVNLFWALQRMQTLVENLSKAADFDLRSARELLLDEALNMHRHDLSASRRMGALGQTLILSQAKILTHCNAGALATGGYGTALGMIYSAHEVGKKIVVFADETRPFLQGSRLTAWELHKNNVPVTIICDNMAGYLMKTHKIDLVIVGADRVARNGDVANKIGTYSLAILAREHKIPFYVAAPLNTIDFKTATGEDIPIEERKPAEVIEWHGKLLAPAGVSARNPAFDVTPHQLISAIVTEDGIAKAPYELSLKALAKQVSY